MTKRKPAEETLTPEMAAFLDAGRPVAAVESRSLENKPAQLPTNQGSGLSTEELLAVLPAFPDNALAPLNVRIDPFLARTLSKAATVRKYQQQAPWSQREIVSEALEDWFRKNNYLK